jgi:hypothetical protein
MSLQVAPRGQRAVSSFIADQAEQFVDYFHRLPSADYGAAFLRWAESKDLWPKDRRAIEREVRRRLATRDEERRL